MNGVGYAYRDQEAAERAVDRWRADYRQAIEELLALNERLDSKALDAQIQQMEARLRRF